MSSSSYLLEDVLELIIDHRGKTPKKLGFKGFDEKGIPVLSAKHVKNDILVNIEQMRFVNKELYKKWMPIEVKKGDVIITSEAPLGEVYYLHSNQKYVLGQRVFGLRVNKNLLDPEYLVAWLTSTQGQAKLLERATGSTVQGIKQSELRKIEIELPELNIQKKIAQIRSKLNQKITLNNQINETLEAMAQALFKSWFIDFEPVKAKIEAKEAGQDAEGILLAAMSAISGKDSKALKTLQTTAPEEYAELKAIAEQFPDSLEESELGMIPKGWEVKPLEEFIDFLEGPGIRNWQYTDEDTGIKFINIRCIQNGDLNLITANKITQEEAFGRYNHFQLKEDDIVISTSGTLGRYAFVRKEHLPLCLNTSVIRFRPIDEKSTLHFIAGYVHTQLQIELETRATGSAQRNFGPTHLKQISMVVPNYSLLKRHSFLVRNLFLMRKNKLSENDRLTELRDTLLPKLLSGEIDVSNVEIDELLENET